MAAQHTPGPFAVEAPIDGSLMIVEAGKPVHKWRPVAILPLADEKGAIPNDQVLANAHLFAAASELLEALQGAMEALAMCQPRTDHGAACQEVAMLTGRKALAKARGGL